MQDFTKLKAWERAHRFVLQVYKESREFPSDERFGVTSQIRRSAASIPVNIAEGARRTSGPDFARFVDFALGSANETEYHLILARDLGFMSGLRTIFYWVSCVRSGR
ncbi:MAG: four helix bundle protein [Acidimicrobiia bacterium]|nr:four helix bundle protein [Acidimicrobiia bacterium]MDH3397610.1 four helix bundle protein [Acidimicrobiia bacterium]